MKATTLNTLLDDLLTTCANAYAVITGAPAAPTKQFVSFGEPPWYDKVDQLAVWTTGMRLVNPFPLTKTSADFAAVMPCADLMVLVLRNCWPNPAVSSASSSLATPEAIATAAASVNLDGAVLEAHLSNLSVKGGMFPSLPTIGDNDVALSPMVPVGPQGSHVGWRCTIAVKLAIL